MLEAHIKEELLENPLAILRSEAVFLALKSLWLNNHRQVTEPQKFVDEFLAYLKTADGTRPAEIAKYLKKKLAEYAIDDLSSEYPGDMFYELIKGDISGAKTILDFGCGKLAFLKNIAEKEKNIGKFVGIDAWSQPVLEDIDQRIVFSRNLDNIPDNSVDLVTVKLVLHHLESDEAIIEVFKDIKRVLKSGGEMIIFEESFPEIKVDPSASSAADSARDDKIKNTKKYLEKFDFELAEDATREFLELSEEDKINYLYLNDWLMNLKNKYMPWALQYKSMEEWERLAEAVGFKRVESHFIGAVAKRKRRQGMTAVLKFIK